MSNFRGIKEAQLVDVLEGDGTTDSPYQVVSYVVVDGKVIGTVKETSNV